MFLIEEENGTRWCLSTERAPDQVAWLRGNDGVRPEVAEVIV